MCVYTYIIYCIGSCVYRACLIQNVTASLWIHLNWVNHRVCVWVCLCVVVTRHGERTTTSWNRTQLCRAKAKKACLIQNQTKSHTLNNITTEKPGGNRRSYPPWVESRHPRGPVSPYRSSRAGRAPNEWRSRLFKPCFSTCSSGALHVLNWPGPGCHNIQNATSHNIVTLATIVERKIDQKLKSSLINTKVTIHKQYSTAIVKQNVIFLCALVLWPMFKLKLTLTGLCRTAFMFVPKTT